MVTKTEKIMSIAQKRGFFFPSGEIYSVKAGFWTYGHLGTLLKQRWENLWRKTFLDNPNYYEIEDTNILTKEVFESSGHLKNFNDPLVECNKCKFRFRADQYVEDETGEETEALTTSEMDKLITKHKLKCPECGGELGKTQLFNMMFELKVGATGKDIMHLRPETAQAPYLAFKREFLALREKLPMGLAVIGKAFRNEISPRQGFFRLREFTQAELQIFFDPDTIDETEDWNKIKSYKLRTLLVKERSSKTLKEKTCEQLNKTEKIPKLYISQMVKIQKFYLDVLDIPKEKIRFKEISEKERAFYNRIQFDMEIDLETLGGFREVLGLHYRGDHDLSGHQKGSKTKLEVFLNNKRFIPHVIELSFGVDRNIWNLLDNFFKEEKNRTLFTFPHSLSPIDVAIFPLIRKNNLPEVAKKIFNDLNQDFNCTYDETGSIGRMYRRMDEIGCSTMITVDHQTLKDKSVTLRDKNTMKQTRIKIEKLKEKIKKLFNDEIKFEETGKKV
ncbi:MAG: glycine--tRNA ligase [Nanoarchaeota archaeon]|jgi:glycyl-tRNA synthetase|nr:glycine--tRNA ligase [Nanoarchaeota archaeon]|tara:strand:+ start:13782 stop:15287 length:1506 start_codon:yes stop_codon:yes gene_type:complete